LLPRGERPAEAEPAFADLFWGREGGREGRRGDDVKKLKAFAAEGREAC